MTLLIDDTLTTSLIAVPLAQGWVETDVPASVREGLRAADVTSEDVALLSVAEATLLAETHILVSDVAVVLDGIGPIAMRTPVRPDGVEDTVVRLLDIGPTAEMVSRAMLRPYFGITATSFATSDESPGAASAQVVILDGAAGLTQPESGYHEDLAKHWFVFTGQALVSHTIVVGLHAQARGADAEIAALQAAVATGQERRKDVRGLVAERWGIDDRDALAEVTNRQRFALTPGDRNSLANLVARGTWGSRFGKRLPVYRDMLPADNRSQSMDEIVTPDQARQRMIDLMDSVGADYKIYSHRPIRNYDDAELARQESGFSGTESKSLVLKSGDAVIVYVTLAGRRVDFKAVRAHLGGPKPKILGDEELWSRFAAEPGAAYPFGFDEDVRIYVDPAIYGEEWLLLSLVLPTETVQIRGSDIRKVFAHVANPVEEVTTFNVPPSTAS